VDAAWAAEIAGRQSLSLVLLAAVAAKLSDPTAVDTVKAYAILPDRLAPAAGWLLPRLEVALSGVLMIGVFKIYATSIAAALFAAFALGQLSVLARGKKIP
jgi:hypothetical protein